MEAFRLIEGCRGVRIKGLGGLGLIKLKVGLED